MLPASKPKITEERLRGIITPVLTAKGLPDFPSVLLVGIRGYYRDSMGKEGANDRNIYDDCLIILSENVYATFNANTDPSPFQKGVATLCTGLHWYKKGKHGISRPGGGYPAFRPATPDESLPVTRDGQPGISKGIAINIHSGSRNSTSSLGCQTVYPDQWTAFQKLLYAEMDRLKVTRLPYLLIENDGNMV